MKKTIIFIFVLVLFSFTSYAEWYNPFSWFSNEGGNKSTNLFCSFYTQPPSWKLIKDDTNINTRVNEGIVTVDSYSYDAKICEAKCKEKFGTISTAGIFEWETCLASCKTGALPICQDTKTGEDCGYYAWYDMNGKESMAIKIGFGSDVYVYENTTTVVFIEDDLNVNNSLQKWNGATFVTAPDTISITNINNQTFKLSANDSTPYNPTGLNLYQYHWKSNKEISNFDGDYILSMKNGYSTPFETGFIFRTIDTSDICKSYSNCTYYMTNDSKELFVTFYEYAINGSVFIDPSYNLKYTSSSNLLGTGSDFWSNRTGGSSLGARLDAPVLFMDFNTPPEREGTQNYTKDNSIYNNFGVGKAGVLYNATGGYDGSGAYQFDDINDYISLGQPNSLQITKELTLSIWIKPTENDIKGVIGDCAGVGNGYFLYLRSTAGQQFAFGGPGSNYVRVGNVNLNQWQHVVGVISQTDGIKLYQNGVLAGSNPLSGTINTFTGGICIGKVGGIGQYNGSIDQVHILPYALTQEEVLCLYNGTGNCNGRNNSDYLSKYAYPSGDFKSLVFYNSTSTYWNTTLSIADSNGSAETYDLCLNDDNCIAYWDLDTGNTDANPYNDEKGSNHGTPTGTNNATGISSGAIRFDGSDDYVEINDDNSLDLNQTFTISLWVNSNSVSRYILSKESYNLFIDLDNKINFTLYDFGDEILTNPGFEAPYSSGYATGWSKQGSGVGGTQETTIVHSGSSSQKMNSYGYGSVQQAITLTDYVTYKGSGWNYKVDNDIYLRIRINGAPYTSYLAKIINSAGVWYYTEGFINADYTTPAMGSFDANPATIRYVDDYSLREVLNSSSVTTNSALNSGWNHIVASYNGTTLSIYLNDELTSVDKEMNVDANTDSLVLGNYFNSVFGTNYFFNGLLDEVLIYNKSLTSAEVDALYKAGLSQHANTNVTLQTRTASSYNISDAGLVSFYSFNVNQLGNATDDSGNSNTLVGYSGGVGGANDPKWSEENGTVGGGYGLDGTDCLVGANASVNNITTTMTLSAWVKPTTLGLNQRIMGKRADSTHRWLFGFTTANIVQYYQDSGGTYPQSTATVKANEWQHLAFTNDGSIAYIYLNGEVIATDATAQAPLANTGEFNIGAEDETTYLFKGAIDELRIYNRSLSQTEIQNLYKIGSYHIEWNGGEENWVDSGKVEDGTTNAIMTKSKFIQPKYIFETNDTDVSPYIINHSITYYLDLTPPVISEIPINRTILYFTDSVSIKINATDNIQLDRFKVNDTVNFNITWDGQLRNKTLLLPSEYYFRVSVNDTSNNNDSFILNINVSDTESPTFTQYPLNRTLEYYATPLYININATDDYQLDRWYLNDTVRFNITQSGELKNKTTLGVGVYFVNISVNDTSNNINSTVLNINVTDTLIPTFDEYPQNRTLEYYVDLLYIDINATDYSDIYWNVNDSIRFNITQSGELKNFTSLEIGTFYVNVSINDSYDNINSTILKFIVQDTLKPLVNFTMPTPDNNSLLGEGQNYVTINSTCEDYSSFMVNISVYNMTDVLYYNCSYSPCNHTFDIEWDTYYTNVTCIDIYANSNITNVRQFTSSPDATKPHVENNSLKNGYCGQGIEFNADVTDNFGTQYIYLWVNDTTNNYHTYYMSNIAGNNYMNNSFVVISSGKLWYKINATDYYGNSNNTMEWQSFIVNKSHLDLTVFTATRHDVQWAVWNWVNPTISYVKTQCNLYEGTTLHLNFNTTNAFYENSYLYHNTNYTLQCRAWDSCNEYGDWFNKSILTGNYIPPPPIDDEDVYEIQYNLNSSKYGFKIPKKICWVLNMTSGSLGRICFNATEVLV